MTNEAPKNECLKKKICVCKKDQQIMAKIDFHNPNIIDEYNYNVNNVDIYDQ